MSSTSDFANEIARTAARLWFDRDETLKLKYVILKKKQHKERVFQAHGNILRAIKEGVTVNGRTVFALPSN